MPGNRSGIFIYFITLHNVNYVLFYLNYFIPNNYSLVSIIYHLISDI